jgi:hypothetical protein
MPSIKPFQDHERFQTHCRFCQSVQEADSYGESLRMTEAYEEKYHQPTESVYTTPKQPIKPAECCYNHDTLRATSAMTRCPGCGEVLKTGGMLL